MNERKLSELQKEYRAFFLGKLRLYGVASPAELTTLRKSALFTEIKADWAKFKGTKSQTKRSHQMPEQALAGIPEKAPRNPAQTEVRSIEATSAGAFTKQLLRSEPNKEQTDDLRILFTPNAHFLQPEHYQYPVVKMPRAGCYLKLPRIGRSDQKGYTETKFYYQIKSCITELENTNQAHLVIPYYNKPYEPDIVLFDKKLNLYIDVEIDEPYDGYYRYPIHCTKPEEEVKQDDIRDLFFTESGWIVIRFTEKQVHCQPNECITHLKNVLYSIYGRTVLDPATCEMENQWDYNQCIQWQKICYREKYLGIDRFQKQHNHEEIEIDVAEVEGIEKVIQRTKRFRLATWDSNIAFDELTHKYVHPKDETGNAEYISVTTLIERFFPFDLKRYVERKAAEEGRTEEDVLIDFLMVRDEAAEKGTFLHTQIEHFLKGNEFEADSKEFQLFIDFYNNEIKRRSLDFFDAEKIIVSRRYRVAGTMDCLFKKKDSDEYIILDWKRSQKLIVDGHPRLYGFGYALSELKHLDNSSYYRYCLQQNIYKHIVETEYSLKISSMQLVVLHENYPNYYILKVPNLKKEAEIILNSLNHKI